MPLQPSTPSPPPDLLFPISAFSVASLQVGRVVDIRLITDKSSKKSRGLAYVEFARVEEVLAAVALTGQPLLGQAVMIKVGGGWRGYFISAAKMPRPGTSPQRGWKGGAIGG